MLSLAPPVTSPPAGVFLCAFAYFALPAIPEELEGLLVI